MVLPFWQNALYQFTHPWHWLLYGQNSAGLGLLGLVAYVFYTRRMMLAAEVTRRLTLTPYLLAGVGMGGSRLIVTNVAAPAVRCELWGQTVDWSTQLSLLRVRIPQGMTAVYIPAITSENPFSLELRFIEPNTKWLYVLDCSDTSGGKYQLQILQTAVGDSEFTIKASFSIPDTFMPRWRKQYNRLRQYVHLAQIYLSKRKDEIGGTRP